VQGVTSISADTHKYGFAPKGSSVIMYRHARHRAAQYFVAPDWTGGIYASPSIAGSRPGALIAGCWATMVHLGRAGYVAAARRILPAAATIAEGVRRLPQLALYGEPDLSVVCFGAARRTGGGGRAINIYHVNDAMAARGWNLNVLQGPACLHLCVTYANAGSAERFVEDLAAAVAEVEAAPPGRFKDGSAAIYGMAEAVPDKAVVGDIAQFFLDALYKV
jgi:sphinganine-1-phosphate aldolase